MSNLKLMVQDEITQVVETMTSLEIVDLINKGREVEANGSKWKELRHQSFMTKVVHVLGQGAEQNFLSSYFDANNQERKCYKFLKRETMLMLMSYSYDLQAAVYDRLVELENKDVHQISQESAHPRLPVEEAAETMKVMKVMAEFFGLEGNPALISANVATRESTGFDFQKLLGVQLQSKDNKQYLTPTEIGKHFEPHKSAQAINKLIEHCGYQERIDGKWYVTGLGKAYAQVIDTTKKTSNGAMIQQIKWSAEVADLI